MMLHETSQANSILQTLLLSHHERAFRENDIETFEDIQLLSREDLSNLGVVKIGERNRLMAWINHRQKKRSSLLKTSSLENDATIDRKHNKKSNSDDDAMASSLSNIVTQARTLVVQQQQQQCLDDSQMTVNISMTLNSAGKQQRSPQQSSAPLTPQRRRVADTIPELEYSPHSQTTEEDIEESMYKTQRSIPYKRRDFCKQQSVPLLITTKDDAEDHTSQLTHSPSCQTSRHPTPCRRRYIPKQKSVLPLIYQQDGEKDDAFQQTISPLCLKTQHSSQCMQKGFHEQKSVPVLTHRKDIREDNASQKTYPFHSQASQQSSSYKRRDFCKQKSVPNLTHRRDNIDNNALQHTISPHCQTLQHSSSCKRKGFHKQKSVSVLTHQKDIIEDNASQKTYPFQGQTRDSNAPVSSIYDYQAENSSPLKRKSFLKQRSVPLLITKTDIIDDCASQWTHSPDNHAREEGAAEKLMLRDQHCSPCKCKSFLKQNSVQVLRTQSKCGNDSFSQQNHSACNQAATDSFKEKSLRKVERYATGSEYAQVPEAADCKDRFCAHVFNFLVLDMELIKFLTDKFCTMWLGDRNMDELSGKAFDKDAIAKDAIHQFQKIAHTFSHENAQTLCSLPDEVVTRRLHEFRKAALVLACMKCVGKSRGKTSDSSDRAVIKSNRNRQGLPRRKTTKKSQRSLSATGEKEISPREAYQSMKGFWEGVSSFKTPRGIFPQWEPYYKADDPLVHPELEKSSA